MKITRPEDIGALVKDRRRALNLTQAQLAAKAGVSQRYVTQLERARGTLQLGHVLRVLRVLGVDLLVRIPASAAGSARRKPDKLQPPKISIDSLVDG